MNPSLLTLFLLLSFGAVDAVLFTPAIPQIAKFFNITGNVAELTVTLYLFGYAIVQLLYGPLANRWGRKTTLYFGLGLSAIASLLCAFAGLMDSFVLLLIGRVLMAIGGGVGLVLTFTIIADVYPEQKARKVTALAALSFPILPGVATLIGGYLVTWFGWQSCFIFLAAYSLVVLWLCAKLPETGKTAVKLSLKSLVIQYGHYFKRWHVSGNALLFGGCSAIAYMYAVTAPFVAVHQLGLAPDQFGVYNLWVVAAYILGNLLAAGLAKYVSTKKAMMLGFLLILVSIVLLWLFQGTTTPTLFFITASIALLGIPCIFANATVLATRNATDKAQASAVMSFINMMTAVIALLIAETFSGVNILHLVGLFAIVWLVMLIIFATQSKKQYSSNPPTPNT